MEKNNLFKYATKELSQDAFICWLVNYINTDEEDYKKIAKDFIILISEKTKEVALINYVKNNNYKVDIKHQYKGIDILLIIDKYYIVIEDKIMTQEHDDQIEKYKYRLITEDDNASIDNIFTCYYKMFEEYNQIILPYAVISRKDMLNFLGNINNKNIIMQDYYNYLNELEKYSKIRNVKAQDLQTQKSNIVNHIENAIYTSFYNELENEEKDIIDWNYADNRAGGTWWYASKKHNNVQSENYERIYAEINLKGKRNQIGLKLSKKSEESWLEENEKIEDIIKREGKEKEYCENGKIKHIDKDVYYKLIENTKIVKQIHCKYYKILKDKVDIYNQVVTQELLDILSKYDIKENDNKAKGRIKKDNNKNYKYYTRIASIDINKFTLEEVKEIVKDINSYLSTLKIKI